MDFVDVVVIGAGAVGLAAARALALNGREVLVVEAEDSIGAGASSRNSEVIHAGLYYPPGSLKSRMCQEGAIRLYAYCRERHVPHDRIGKLIVASTDNQREALQALHANAAANGVEDLRVLGAAEMLELEPELEGNAALLSPSTGIVDTHALMLSLQGDLEAEGGMVVLKTPFISGRVRNGSFELEFGGDQPVRLAARNLINAAGLSAQRLATMLDGLDRIHIPKQYLAAGYYYSYSGVSPFRRLVYPLPEEGGLGIHATLDLGGQLKFGPDVRWINRPDFNFDDSRRGVFLSSVQRYYPAVDAGRLHPGYTGVRSKLSGPGEAPADFRVDGVNVHGVKGLVNLFGIESPGLTSCLALGDLVAGLIG